MGLFHSIFDFNRDGKIDAFEASSAMQMAASSRREAIDLTGDDTFYLGSDNLDDDEDELEEELELSGLDRDELELMDNDERREALENAGLDPDDFDDDF